MATSEKTPPSRGACDVVSAPKATSCASSPSSLPPNPAALASVAARTFEPSVVQLFPETEEIQMPPPRDPKRPHKPTRDLDDVVPQPVAMMQAQPSVLQLTANPKAQAISRTKHATKHPATAATACAKRASATTKAAPASKSTKSLSATASKRSALSAPVTASHDAEAAVAQANIASNEYDRVTMGILDTIYDGLHYNPEIQWGELTEMANEHILRGIVRLVDGIDLKPEDVYASRLHNPDFYLANKEVRKKFQKYKVKRFDTINAWVSVVKDDAIEPDLVEEVSHPIETAGQTAGQGGKWAGGKHTCGRDAGEDLQEEYDDDSELGDKKHHEGAATSAPIDDSIQEWVLSMAESPEPQPHKQPTNSKENVNRRLQFAKMLKSDFVIRRGIANDPKFFWVFQDEMVFYPPKRPTRGRAPRGQRAIDPVRYARQPAFKIPVAMAVHDKHGVIHKQVYAPTRDQKKFKATFGRHAFLEFIDAICQQLFESRAQYGFEGQTVNIAIDNAHEHGDADARLASALERARQVSDADLLDLSKLPKREHTLRHFVALTRFLATSGGSVKLVHIPPSCRQLNLCEYYNRHLRHVAHSHQESLQWNKQMDCMKENKQFVWTIPEIEAIIEHGYQQVLKEAPLASASDKFVKTINEVVQSGGVLDL
eukprot:m.356477 g.356477  ORF g.356477 m.356477 type:complete len:656 (+) comp17551_c0_seq1:228-2195(+)